jgi:nucleotidyltransferase AbiEii toxin of type IV toxin-antitoxin system
MRLFEHEDFQAICIDAARRFSLPDQFIEKDYYVTEALRIAADAQEGHLIFKGGTSLSKGWHLLERFSEDLDLFLNPESYDPPLSARGVDRELKGLRDAVASHPGLAHDPDSSRTIGGFGREDVFRYASKFGDIPGIPATVKFEAGIQSGAFPVETVMISSFVADRLKEQGLSKVAEDLESFPMSLLHFRRTFVEKLFTVHGKVERLKREGERLRRSARHYADLYVLAGRSEVLAMIGSAEYAQIRTDYNQKSIRFFKNSYRPPDDLRFNQSDALFLPGTLRAMVEEDYYADCRLLFRDEPPAFDAVIERLQGLAAKL